MELFTLLRREIKEPPYRLFAFSVLSGLSNAFLIGIINSVAKTAANNMMDWKYFIMYLLSMIIFIATKRYILDQTSDIVEMIVCKVRYRLADKIRHAEFADFEKQGTSIMYSRLSQDATVISTLTTSVISGFQHALMIVFTLLYLSTVSIWAAGLILASLVLGLFYYLTYSESLAAMWRSISIKETEFFVKIEHILKGFKENNINRRKNENVFNDYVKVNNDIRLARMEMGEMYNTKLIYAQLLSYVLLCAILFGLPKFHTESAEVIMKVVATILFIMGPLESFLYAIPTYAKANAAAQNILELEELLEKELGINNKFHPDPNAPAAYEMLPFKSHINIKGLGFQYENMGESGFRVGPLDLTIQQGELVFITGGNGSGKSTFLKLLTGLYRPSLGSICVDAHENSSGTPITLSNHQQYQNLFSTIFSDYYLFDRLYGSEKEPDPATVNALLRKMELNETITRYEHGRFTSIHLSSGQKKRIALIAAILEDKPIYVFDEVAADLDPEFRDKFYYEILPDLKSRNKTLLVVSHDQQYWSVADRLLNFRDGTMREMTKKEVDSLLSIELTRQQEI